MIFTCVGSCNDIAQPPGEPYQKLHAGRLLLLPRLWQARCSSSTSLHITV